LIPPVDQSSVAFGRQETSPVTSEKRANRTGPADEESAGWLTEGAEVKASGAAGDVWSATTGTPG